MPETIETSTAVDTQNPMFRIAAAFVTETNEHLFLTGRAGTGKTTFLKYIKDHCRKQCAIVAPTGVAAINAGGETIHSFLQLPFGPFVPGSAGGFNRREPGTEDQHSLLANLKMRDTKLKLLRRLELLIIDEVSMVRADLLDAMDLVLRHVRKCPLPFGGVQMLFIGDLFQLPPVAQEEEWYILRRFYSSPYFFDSVVLRQNPPLYIELKKVYRQKEQGFIDILNRVRNGTVTWEDIDTLNSRYDAGPIKESGYIILSTHNRIADEVNRESLERLSSPVHTFKGAITAEFNPKNLPTEEVLQLKKGAQVMFIKNDLQSPRRYYNGKIATISSIDTDGIWVTFPGETGGPIAVPQETWKNMRYTLNGRTGQIEEEESGSFTQYPIRLAWAVTVHKSQGLTLEKAAVDLSQSFAPGQVYVALSRCTSMEGLILRSRLSMENVIVDDRVMAFADTEPDDGVLDTLLMQGKRRALVSNIARIFSFSDLITTTEQLQTDMHKLRTGPKEKNTQLCENVLITLRQAQGHALGFHKQIAALVAAGDETRLQERRDAARTYFSEKVLEPAITSIDGHILSLGTLTKVAKQVRVWKELNAQMKQKAVDLAGE